MIISSKTVSDMAAPGAHHTPDLAALINWLASWIQESGAIHGFHNHSVWGGNPYRWGDFTAGHTTFASLLLPLLARLDARGTVGAGELLKRALSFQLESRQPNGEFAHIGFQVGEALTGGLIHNVVPCVSLLLALKELSQVHRETYEARIISVVSEVLAACDQYGPRASADSCANQEYTRQWARLLLSAATNRLDFAEMALGDLDFLGSKFLVPGLPDEASSGCLRGLANPDVIEPAEYYGLMIEPLLLAHQLTENPLWLAQALALSRHVARSSWVDKAGMRRFHRLYYRPPEGPYTRIAEPMLIAGMGVTLEAIRKCAARANDAGLANFVTNCHRTLAHYQHPSGFFLSATGWNSEVDLVPSTAWHSHDAWHLLNALDVVLPKIEIAGLDAPVSLLLGLSCFYAECGPHWRIGDYLTEDTYSLLGRKDHIHFGRDMVWVGGPRSLPDNYAFPHALSILKTDTNLVCCRPLPPGCRVLNASHLPLETSGSL
jgi:hypothetical protein